MSNENKTIASEIIAEHEDRFKTIIEVLDTDIDSLLEKGRFLIEELMGIVDETPENKTQALLFANNQKRMSMLTHIIFDYIFKTQQMIDEIIKSEK